MHHNLPVEQGFRGEVNNMQGTSDTNEQQKLDTRERAITTNEVYLSVIQDCPSHCNVWYIVGRQRIVAVMSKHAPCLQLSHP